MINEMQKLKEFWRSLGPGLIASVADDDPSSITTTAIAGAKFGLATLWTALFTLPFMIVVQRMSGRIGLVSGKGLAGNMRKHYPAWILVIVTTIILVVNIINIGADISGMTTAVRLLVPWPAMLVSASISVIIILLLIFLSYRQIAQYLKWIAVVMLAYVVSALLVKQPWHEIALRIFAPPWSSWGNREYLKIIIAIFGTTISPYLFFWQASEAVEEGRFLSENGSDVIPDIGPHARRSKYIIKNEVGAMYKDIYYGMAFSNIITFFIIILTASTLFTHGYTNISTLEDIANTLKPLAGQYSNVLFLIGILASGILAIPVLAGSAAYAVAEIFGWRDGFDNNFGKAKQFYLVIILATLIGLGIEMFHLNPVNILFYTAVIFGMVSPVIIALVIHMANNPKVMGQFTSRPLSNILAYILLLIMSASVVAMFFL
jgi:NRAMP (natural resistance-associated macrophage protein)-like metal ion transporter